MEKLLIILFLSYGMELILCRNLAPTRLKQNYVADLEEKFGENLFKNHPNLKYYNIVKCGYRKNPVVSWAVKIVAGDSNCGGSLINNGSVLTSASCAEKFKNSPE